jgi:hypothetical protein
MPFTLRVEAEARIAIMACAGELGLADAKQGALLLWESQESGTVPVVGDLRSARLSFSAVDIREIARFIHERQPEKPLPRLAVVATRDLEFGLARMFETWREDRSTDVRVFRDYDEAVRWAGSPDTSAA